MHTYVATSLLDINWLEVFSTVGLVGGAVWTLAVTSGNNRWAPKKEMEQVIARMEQDVIQNKIFIEKHTADQSIHTLGEKFVTRAEWNHERDVTHTSIEEVKSLIKEQRDLTITILSRLRRDD